MTRHALYRLLFVAVLALYVAWACVRLLTAPVAATEARVRLDAERRELDAKAAYLRHLHGEG